MNCPKPQIVEPKEITKKRTGALPTSSSHFPSSSDVNSHEEDDSSEHLESAQTLKDKMGQSVRDRFKQGNIKSKIKEMQKKASQLAERQNRQTKVVHNSSTTTTIQQAQPRSAPPLSDISDSEEGSKEDPPEFVQYCQEQGEI